MRSPSAADTDPHTRWELRRKQWLSPSPSAPPSSSSHSTPQSTSTSPRDDASLPSARSQRKKDPLFQQRIATLEAMLRNANSAASGSSEGLLSAPSPLLAVPALAPAANGGVGGAESGPGSSGSHVTLKGNGNGKAREVPMGEDEADGGDVVGYEREGDGEDNTKELKKVSEGIFLAFKQNRAPKEPLPLSLVTSLLYRSWTLDGTIPANYNPNAAEPEPPMPIPRSFAAMAYASPTTTSAVPSPVPFLDGPTVLLSSSKDGAPLPSLLGALAAHNPNAVTPLPSSSSPNAPPPMSPLGATTVSAAAETQSEMPPPPVPPKQPDPAPDLEGMGACGESGKLKLDMMRGSRWRTERDVASGSDVM